MDQVDTAAEWSGQRRLNVRRWWSLTVGVLCPDSYNKLGEELESIGPALREVGASISSTASESWPFHDLVVYPGSFA